MTFFEFASNNPWLTGIVTLILMLTFGTVYEGISKYRTATHKDRHERRMLKYRLKHLDRYKTMVATEILGSQSQITLTQARGAQTKAQLDFLKFVADNPDKVQEAMKYLTTSPGDPDEKDWLQESYDEEDDG